MEQFHQGQPLAGANPLDPTGAGGGTIGTGQAPIPENKDLLENDGQAGVVKESANSRGG